MNPAGDSTRAERSLIAPGGKIDERAVRAAIAREEESEEDQGGLREVSFRLSRDLRKRLDLYLTDRIAYISRARARRLIEGEMVRVNGRFAKPSTRLRVGDLVEVVVPPPESKEITPEDIPLSVLFEDPHIIVLNKSPDIIVHPARSHVSGTMVNALAWRFQQSPDARARLSSVGEELARPGVIHRLDKQTSGVIVFAKHESAHWRIAQQFEKRSVDKRYLAIVAGAPEPHADVIDLPIGPHPSNEKGLREKYVVRHDEWGKPSVTIYRMRERYERFSLLEIELRTGRTHQIRVHLSHEGHPLVGDDMYGGPLLDPETLEAIDPSAPEAAAPAVFRRQALHAASLVFDHPESGERMTFTASLPDDMLRLVRAMRQIQGSDGRSESLGGALDLDAIVPSSDDGLGD